MLADTVINNANSEQQTEEDTYPYIYTYSAIGIIGTLSLIYLICIIVVIWRRNYQPLKARSPVLVLLTCFSSLSMITLLGIREWIGRPSFPCGLFEWSLIVSAVWIPLPWVLRAWRLYFIYALNHAKLALFAQSKSSKKMGAGAASRDSSRDSSEVLQALKTVKRLQIFVSDWFLLLIFFAANVIVSLIWVFLANIQSAGCLPTGSPATALWALFAGVELAIMLVVLIVFTVLMRNVREAFYIRYETYWTFLMMVLSTIAIYAIGAPPQVALVLARYFNTALVSFVFTAGDVIVSAFIPAMATFSYQKKQEIMLADVTVKPRLKDTLYRDPETYELFKQFCVKEWSVENILFIEAVKNYSEAPNDIARGKVARDMYQRFFKQDAALALNITAVHQARPMERYHKIIATVSESYKTSVETLTQEASTDMLSPTKTQDSFSQYSTETDVELAESQSQQQEDLADGNVWPADLWFEIVDPVEHNLADTFGRFVFTQEYLAVVDRRAMQSHLAESVGLR